MQNWEPLESQSPFLKRRGKDFGQNSFKLLLTSSLMTNIYTIQVNVWQCF